MNAEMYGDSVRVLEDVYLRKSMKFNTTKQQQKYLIV